MNRKKVLVYIILGPTHMKVFSSEQIIHQVVIGGNFSSPAEFELENSARNL